MSLQTLVTLSVAETNLAKTFINVHNALVSCDSVKGLFSVQRLSGESYIKLERYPIAVADDNCSIESSTLDKLTDEINGCSEGFRARWEVRRHWPNDDSTKIESWNYYIDFLFEPVSHRSYVLTGIDSPFFIDAGSQRYFLPKNLDSELAKEAASLNLQLLIEELGTLATIPSAKLLGIPVHLIDPENDDYLQSLWLCFGSNAGSGFGEDVGVEETAVGPLYYSLAGPLGNIFGR